MMRFLKIPTRYFSCILYSFTSGILPLLIRYSLRWLVIIITPFILIISPFVIFILLYLYWIILRNFYRRRYILNNLFLNNFLFLLLLRWFLKIICATTSSVMMAYVFIRFILRYIPNNFLLLLFLNILNIRKILSFILSILKIICTSTPSMMMAYILIFF